MTFGRLLKLSFFPTILVFAACTSTVSRVPAQTQIDLSGQWNDVDSQQVAAALVEQSLSTPWIENYSAAQGHKPAVIIGTIANKSSEHIPVKTLVADFERSFINSGRVSIIASPEERESIRAERQDQQQYASGDSMKSWGKERGADFMLIGEINSITDAAKNKEVRYYQVDCYLVNLEDNTKVWTGFKKIKKYIGRSKYRP